MKKSLEPKQRRRQKDNSYSTSGDDSYNNSIYQIRTNHQKKSIPYKNNPPVEARPNIIWVNSDNQAEYERIGGVSDRFDVASQSGQPHEYSVRTPAQEDAAEIIPQEVRMVLQARGSPPVELAAKILSTEDTGQTSVIKYPRDSTTNKSTESFQSKLKSNFSGSTTRVVSSNDAAIMSQAPDEVYNNTWYSRPECGRPVCTDDCDYSGGNYCPGDTRHSSTYDSTSQMSRRRRLARRSIHCSAGDPPVMAESSTHRDSSCDAPRCCAQPIAVRTNKNCNDSKTCDCFMETPKKVSTIYLCEKHPSDSRTYCCREVLDKDITPTSAAPSVVCVSPRIARKAKVCEYAYPEPAAPLPKRRHPFCTPVTPIPKYQSSVTRRDGDCKCIRKNRNQCKANCAGDLGKLFKEYIPAMFGAIFKLIFIILVYILLLWLLRLYTALNHYAHLTLLSANILMLFILAFEPDCLYIFMLGDL